MNLRIVAKRTPNTEFLKKNLTTKRCLTFKQTLIETCIEIGLKIKELLVKIPSELHYIDLQYSRRKEYLDENRIKIPTKMGLIYRKARRENHISIVFF
jgi:hypothetical protein